MHYFTPQCLLPFLAALPSILASPAVIPRQSTCHVFGEVDGEFAQTLWLTMTNANGATLPATSQAHTEIGGDGNAGVSAQLINQAMPYQMTAVFNMGPIENSDSWSVTFTYGAWGPVTVPLVQKGPLSSDLQIWTDAIPFPC